MHRLFNTITFLFFISKSFGQSNSYPDTFSVSIDTIINYVSSSETIQTEPRFVYKNYSWQEYLAQNLNSHIINQNGAPKDTTYNVVVTYLITKTGKITDLKISVPVPDFGMIKEITNFYKNSPLWIPATQNGRNVVYRKREMIEFVSN